MDNDECCLAYVSMALLWMRLHGAGVGDLERWGTGAVVWDGHGDRHTDVLHGLFFWDTDSRDEAAGLMKRSRGSPTQLNTTQGAINK